MVLAAGYGTRLGELTRDLPKPMLEIGGRPILEHILNHLVRHGFTEIAVNLHFMPEVITSYFGDGSQLAAELHYSHERELLGTAGGLKRMAAFVGAGGSFVVQYGDVLTDHDLGRMLELHRSRQALATLLVHPRRRSNSVLELDDEGRITSFLERPSEAERRGIDSPWVNSGLCIAEPELLERIANGGPSDLPRDVLVPLVASGRLFADPLVGWRCAVDSAERLAEARAALELGHWRPTSRQT
jgi:NDP-sugar pyrophosphorylase family protein